MRTLAVRFLVIPLLLACGRAVADEPVWTAELGAYATQQLEKWKVPGAAVGIVQGGKLVFARGFGLRDRDRELPTDANTLFAIGSITKSFTATAVALLVDDGRMQWEDRVVDLVPGFRLKDEFATHRLTPIDLLSHRSGLPDHNMVWYVTDFDRAELVRRLRYLEPSADLRTEFLYNPLMYNAAGYLVEQVSGMSWENFTRQRLFSPLGMERSNFSNEEFASDPNHAKPYVERDGEVTSTELHPSQTLSGPAGSINSSVVELGAWMILHLQRGNFKGKQLVSAAAMDRMHSPQMVMPAAHPVGEGPEGPAYSYVSYGLGWILGTYHDQLVVEHSGSIDGYASKMTLLPRVDAGVVILTNNQMGGDSFIYAVETRILGQLMGRKPFDASEWLSKQKREGPAPLVQAPSVERSTPDRSLDEFVGSFENPGYGEIKVGRDGTGMRLRYYRYDVELVHVKHDIFKTVGGVINRHVSFLSGPDGDIDRMEIQWERAVDPIVFRRTR